MAKRKGLTSCEWAPKIDGANSTLFVGLQGLVQSRRPLGNLLYATYLQPGVAEAMDREGYKRNKQGQHYSKDVFEYLDGYKYVNEYTATINTEMRALGLLDGQGKLVDFTSKEAFDKATEINGKYSGKVASVRQTGDKFNVILENRDSRTQIRAGEVQKQLTAWQALTEQLNALNIDADSLSANFEDIVNPLKVSDFLHYLHTLKRTKSTLLNERDIKLLLSVAKEQPVVSNLLNRGWGTLDEIASKVKDIITNPDNHPESTVTFTRNAIVKAKDFVGDAFDQLYYKMDNVIIPKFKEESSEYNMQKTLDELHNKYGIDSNAIVRIDDNINTLMDAVAEASLVLQRQIDLLERQKGRNAQGMELENNLRTLNNEIAGKKYFSGLLTFLKQASKYSNTVDGILKNISTAGTMQDYIAARAAAFSKVQTMRDGYYHIVKALANIENLNADVEMSDADKANLKAVASEILATFDSWEKAITELQKDTMIDIGREVFGGDIVDGKPLADIITMTEGSRGMMDMFYRKEAQSNPLAAMLGTVIHDEQVTRDKIIADIFREIRRITSEYSKNPDTRFMYEQHGSLYYIASPYDWAEYNKQYNKAYGAFIRNQQLRGFELKDAMESWVEDNTEWVIVDPENGRKERVPRRDVYGNEHFQEGWTDAQKVYYDKIMALKGKLGTLLPAYAQQQFLPPQVRNEWYEVIERGLKGEMSFKEVVKNLLERMNAFSIKENDEFDLVVNGMKMSKALGDYKGRILRQIPVMFINRVKDQNNLSFDFSFAMEQLARTAVNYDSMSSIKDTVEMMGDYINQKKVYSRKGKVIQAEATKDEAILVTKLLKKYVDSKSVRPIVDGFIERELYGITLEHTGFVTRLIQKLINYTSLNVLAPNVKGAISNILVGEAQMIIDALAGSVAKRFGNTDVMYSVSDYALAQAQLFGNKLAPGAVMEHLSNDVYSKGKLLEEMFDPMQSMVADFGGKYRKSLFMKLFGGFDVMGMYSAGEGLIHLTNMYAVLNHEKVLVDGKKVSLYSALQKTNKLNGNPTLKIVDGATKLDGTPIEDSYLDDVKAKIRFINEQTHGAMSRDDKGLIHRQMMGRAIMNFRQWMVEHYSRRYRGRHWDGVSKKWVEGYWTTVGKLLKTVAADLFKFQIDSAAHWNELDDVQKMNVARVGAEVAVVAALFTLNGLTGDPSDHKDEWFYRMYIYQVKRLLLEEMGSIPVGIPKQGVQLLNSPIASMKTIEHILYPVTGLGDIDDTLKSGRYKGYNKYLINNLRYNVPFYHQIDQTIHIADEDYIFNVFDR